MQYPHFDRLLGILGTVLEAYSAVLVLPVRPSDPEENREHYVASAFSLGDNLDETAAIHEGRGLVGWILRHREPLRVDNFDQRRNQIGYYLDNEEQTIKAFMGCALPGGGGAVCVDSKRQYSFSEKDQKMLQLFAEFIAQMETERRALAPTQGAVRYYAALRSIYTLRRQYSRWAEFLRHFLDLMATMTGFSYCAMFTRDAEGETYAVEGENTRLLQHPGVPGPSFPMTHGVVGWVFRNGSQVRNDGTEGAPDTQLAGKVVDTSNFQTVLAVPLVIQRKTRGVLCLAHETPLEISEVTQDFVRMAAEHLALFLENLYVKSRLRDLYEQIHADEDAPPPQ